MLLALIDPDAADLATAILDGLAGIAARDAGRDRKAVLLGRLHAAEDACNHLFATPAQIAAYEQADRAYRAA